MCIILPVDHIPCSHTVAIWQHCVKAARFAQGMRPCNRVRQHPRPILTRKLCVHCGGPRYFARRGGIAGRGSGSPTVANACDKKDDYSESYDSGYHSDVIHEEDEDEDVVMSPTAPIVPTKRPREVSKKRSSSHTRSPSSRRPSWRPNLKREMSAEHASYRNQSIDETISEFEGKCNITATTRSTTLEYTAEESVAPVLSRPPARRKSSTLLHPSSPSPEPWSDADSDRPISSLEITPPSSPLLRPAFMRQDSSLLHPSSPDMDTNTSFANAKSFPFNFSLPLPKQRQQPPTSVPDPTPPRPGMTPRKNSTLLHPSPPPDEQPDAPCILPIHAKTILSLPPTPQATPTSDTFQLRRSESLKRTSTSTLQWDKPLHSSHSDGEDDSEGDMTESESRPHGEKAVLARTGRMGRASRISLLSDGNGRALRILQDL